jgi:glutathione S-transferase
MPARLFVLHGSHPSVTVEQALDLKGVPYRKVELLVGTQPLVMKRLFGGTTVPGIRFADGEKVHGSRPILRALEQRVPNPPLYDGPAGAAAIDEAERWGEEIFQPVPRQLLWMGFGAFPRAMHAFQQGQRNPKLPMAMVLGASKVILPVERRINNVSEASVVEAIAGLPPMLDHVDALVTAGVLNGAAPNAADFQIAPTLRLLWAMTDLRPLMADRPAMKAAWRWLDPMPAEIPAGALPMAKAGVTAPARAAASPQAQPTATG